MLTGNARPRLPRLLDKAYRRRPGLARRRLRLDHDVDKIFVGTDPEMRSLRAALVGYTFPDGNAIGRPLIGVGRYIAQGLTNLDKATARACPRSTGPTGPTASKSKWTRRRRVQGPENGLGLRRRQGDQPRHQSAARPSAA